MTQESPFISRVLFLMEYNIECYIYNVVWGCPHGYYALLAEDLLATEQIYHKFCQGIFFGNYIKKKKILWRFTKCGKQQLIKA